MHGPILPRPLWRSIGCAAARSVRLTAARSVRLTAARPVGRPARKAVGDGRTHHSQRASSVLYALLLMPVLLLALAMVVDLGSLQIQRQRFRSAVDMAAVTAATVSARPQASDRLDTVMADAVLRQSLVENLSPLQSTIVGTDPAALAASAEVVAVTTLPAADPFNPGNVVTAPTVEARVSVPVHPGLVLVPGMPAAVSLTVIGRADLQIARGATP